VYSRRSTIDEIGIEEESPLDFESIFHTHYERITRAIAQVVGDRACAEELATEVFWTLWRNPKIQTENAAGWLYRTAVRRGLYELRRRARHARYQSLLRWTESPATPEQLLGATEEQGHVRRVLGTIKPKQAELLLLRSHGFSYEELASALKLNPTSVGTLIVRAQQAFRKEYMRHYGEPRNQR
jgi:RNA polymerase sigma-70 factor (ECF subfamily)